MQTPNVQETQTTEYLFFVPAGTHEIGTMLVSLVAAPVRLTESAVIVGCGYKVTNTMFLNEPQGLHLSVVVSSAFGDSQKSKDAVSIETVRLFIVSRVAAETTTANMFAQIRRAAERTEKTNFS